LTSNASANLAASGETDGSHVASVGLAVGGGLAGYAVFMLVLMRFLRRHSRQRREQKPLQLPIEAIEVKIKKQASEETRSRSSDNSPAPTHDDSSQWSGSPDVCSTTSRSTPSPAILSPSAVRTVHSVASLDTPLPSRLQMPSPETPSSLLQQQHSPVRETMSLWLAREEERIDGK
jgi:hypothetical protein